MALVGIGINLKLLQDYCFCLKQVTKVKCLEMSNVFLLSKQGLTLPGVRFSQTFTSGVIN